MPAKSLILFCLVFLRAGTLITYAADVEIHRDIIGRAQRYIGSGYCRGGTAPPCFDCSGFVRRLYADFVPNLPRVSRRMAEFGTAVARDELAPGDLIFFATGTRTDVVSHVAVYVGGDSIIHAISNGPNRGVTVTELSARYWRTRYHSAARVLPIDQAADEVRRVEGLRLAHGRYTGEIENGEPHGSGRFVMNNGDVYIGEFRDGLFHGTGEYRWAEGRVYRGAFTGGAIAGETARTESPRTYRETARSPWDTWDGIVAGDYYAWREEQDQAFEEWKEQNRSSGD